MSNKAIFLDRDDTLIEDPGYISSAEQVKLLDGAAGALIELGDMGYKLIVVSNQSAVARGIVTEKALGQIHNRLKELLSQEGAFLDRIYYCPYHPEGSVAKYRKDSDLRKPNPGMLLAAAEEMDIDLGRSWMIGNSGSDVEAGLRAGCKTILIENCSHTSKPWPGEPKPDHKAVNMKEAVNIIKRNRRSSGEHKRQTDPVPEKAAAGRTQPAPETVEQRRILEPAESAASPAAKKQKDDEPRIEELLSHILEQVKSMRRVNMFGEFSITRLMAGVVQITALFCLLLGIWFLMSPSEADNAVFIALGFAMLLQMMALTLYIMQGRK